MRCLLCVFTWLVLVVGATALPAAAQSAEIVVHTPESGAAIQGRDVTIDFSVSGFSLVKSAVPLSEAGKRPEANRPGEGHIHFMLDVWPVVVWENNQAYTFTDVPPGEHQLMVELVNNDHSSLSPPVVQQIRFRTAMPMPASGMRQSNPNHVLLLLSAVAMIGVALVLRWQARVCK